MTLPTLLSENNITLSRIDLQAVGERISKRYKSTIKVKPEKVPYQSFMVNDYPDDWMKTKGLRTVADYIAASSVKK